LRISLRRLRTLAAAFRAVWTPDDAAFLRDYLSAWNQQLGELRDRDVALQEFPLLLQDAPAPLHAAGDELVRWLRGGRDAAKATALAHWRGAEHLAGRARLEAISAAEALHGERALADAAATAREHVARAARKVRRKLRKLPADPPMAKLHELRLAIKRLR